MFNFFITLKEFQKPDNNNNNNFYSTTTTSSAVSANDNDGKIQ